jgi:DNA modification methylase
MTTADMRFGDCRKVIPELPEDTSIDCVLTDPPYGIAFQSTYGKNPEAREKYQKKIEDDEDVQTAIDTFDEAMRLAIPLLAPVCELYVFSKWTVADRWIPLLRSYEDHGITLEQLIIWENGYPGIGDVKTNWGCGHEFIFYLKRGRRPVPYRRIGVIHVDKVRPGTNVHPTQKPTQLLKTLIEYSTDPGQTVFDPFAGSGSTLVAARELGRNSIGVEKDQQHYEVALSRLAQGNLLGL